MENEFFMSAGIQPWRAMELNCASNPSNQCAFYTPDINNWEASLDQSHNNGVQFDSAISSMVSSPAASNSNNASENALMIRELIGKLGRIGNGNSNASLAEIPPHSSRPVMPSPAGFSSANTSCYITPLSSPPKVSLPTMGLNSSVADFSADPGFAERAAKFSCFGSRSFNGRTNPIGITNPETSPYGLTSSTRFPRVSSSPSLKALGPGARFPAQPTKNNLQQQPVDRSEMASSQEESSVSDQRENGPKGSSDMNSRKRKAALKGKAKESTNAAKVAEANEDSNAKRCKQNESNGKENETVKAEEDEKKTKNDAKKPPEPPKDYIHVRARRGQATDSHSLAERVRREKISERMKLLQDLVPGCNKVIGKALMLDEIINYVQSLQRQVEFLSMKLASVNTSMDLSMDKDMFQSNNSMANPPMFPMDSSAFHGLNISDGTVSHCSADPLSMGGACRSLDAHLPSPNDLQYQNFCGGDLQTIVQMGFGQNSHQDSAYSLQPFHGRGQTSQMKVEL
ncbi:transcription factor bHLH62-like [Punica granatum]|uniref:BHLH domain-containing protein n=2 Tax=Punica granatum TaxID=22663 RepID=A0A218XDA4_PUNGR|nr:transcription factor bHLH62-like [Punica granatum]OWM82927.1 hypothetical protein CDL15_Pgr005327 [Punica granatum]PKI67371.1 hypothetical protein CRG98_012241 [Punica granatum]